MQRFPHWAFAVLAELAFLLLASLPAEEPPAEPAKPQAEPKQKDAPQPLAVRLPADDFAFLGLRTRPGPSGAEPPGPVVSYIYPGSAAAEMDLRVGDRIVTLNDLVIPDQDTLVRELRRTSVGASVRFKIVRGTEQKLVFGKLGSHAESMRRYEEFLRKSYYGQPLPEPPAILWWNRETGKWEEKPEAWRNLRGKVTVVVSFDDCRVCKDHRYGMLMRLRTLMAASARQTPLGFVGVYYDERPGKTGKEASLRAATDLFRETSPEFPVALAYWPGDESQPELTDMQFLLLQHGTAILNADGKIAYLQISGLPGTDFLFAYEKALKGQETQEKAPETKEPK